jgi:acyl-CoA dehydrogenase
MSAHHAETPEDVAASMASWLRSRGDVVRDFREQPGTFEEAVERDRRLQALLWDEGWTRWGWLEAHGGRGGTIRHRAAAYEQLAVAGVFLPEPLQIVEVAGSAIARFAPELAAARIPPAARGDEVWALGLSEPESGSDLASLRTRIRPDATGDGFRVAGNKIWNGFGHLADYSFALCRSGDRSDGPGSLAAVLIDLRVAGVTRRPIRAMTGRNEFAEMFFDDVAVPASHLVGELDAGWAVIAHMMQFERGTYAWPRQARLHHRMTELIAIAAEDVLADQAARLGEVYLDLVALRLKCRQSMRQLADPDGGGPGPTASIDKLLVVEAETAFVRLAHDLLSPGLELSDAPEMQLWRHDYLYSRALSIFGGANEIQRNIVAERVLGMPRDPR